MSGVSSYPRTRGTYVAPEVIQALLAQGLISEEEVQGYNEAVLSAPPSGRELIKDIVQVILKGRRNDVVFLDRVNTALLLKHGSAENSPFVVTTYHHTGARRLRGFSYRPVSYARKLDRNQYKQERQAFDRSVRGEWLKHIGRKESEQLQAAGLSQKEIDRMVEEGKPPDGYQVHHRIPLDDGGSNHWDNLILMKDNVEHRALHGYYNPAELRIRQLAYGEIAVVALPVPPPDSVIYPNPAMGYVSEVVGYADFLEMFDER
jgi:hypothetical protein